MPMVDLFQLTNGEVENLFLLLHGTLKVKTKHRSKLRIGTSSQTSRYVSGVLSVAGTSITVPFLRVHARLACSKMSQCSVQGLQMGKVFHLAASLCAPRGSSWQR